MLTPFKLTDNQIPIKVGDDHYIYKDVYNPIEWHNGDPYRPRVEMLVLRPGGYQIFLRLNEDGSYRLPGGSTDPDSSYQEQAKNETREEALLLVKDDRFTGMTYYQEMDKDYIKKGGDTPLAYAGCSTYLYTAFVYGKADKTTIEEKDLDDDMANHGAFYDIPSVITKLRTVHIEALLKDDTLPLHPMAKQALYQELQTRQTKTVITPMFEASGIDPHIYHGSIHYFETFYPMSLDLGNGVQKPGWSTFCFFDYTLAKRFAFMRLLQSHLESYKDKGKNYVCEWDLQKEKPYLHKTVYEEIKEAILGQSFYVYTLDGSKLELGMGNDIRFPEVTFREAGVLPEDIDRITVTEDLFFQDCYLVEGMDIPTYAKKTHANLSKTHRGWLSCMLNHNYSEDSVITKLTKAVADGKLKPGDDVEAYMRENHIQMKDISFMERLPAVTKTVSTQEAFDVSPEIEEEWILGDNRVVFTSEKKKEFSPLVTKEMLPDWEEMLSCNPITFHKGYLYLKEGGELSPLGSVDATYCEGDKNNVGVRIFIEPLYRKKKLGTILLRDTFRRIVSPSGEPFHILMTCSNTILDKIPKLKPWAEREFSLSEITKKATYTLFQSAQRMTLIGTPLEEACRSIDDARKFVSEVGKLAKKYDANYFIVTDGASGKSNKGNENPAVEHARKAHMEWENQNGIDPYEDWKKGIPGAPFYFYHLVPKGANLSNGIVSLQYQYDKRDYTTFRNNAMKYAERLCGSWGIYPNRQPVSLTNEELLNGICQFRQDQKDGANQIYLFPYPPYMQLGKQMQSVLKGKDLYRINLNDAEVTNWILRINWGYVGSDSRNAPLTKMDYIHMTKEEYFSSYQESENSLLFAPLNHIAIIPKKGYLPKKLWEKVPIPVSQNDIEEHGSYMMVESVRPSEVDLTKFSYYHAEPARKGFNPTMAGGWDEELYSKDISFALRNDCNNVKEDQFEAHLYTMDNHYQSIYLGKLSVRRFGEKSYGWEWAEQAEISPQLVDYLKEEQRGGLQFTTEQSVVDCDIIDLTETNTSIEDALEEAVVENWDLEPIFIVCSFTGTTFGKLIQKFQHCTFSHSGISFDASLKDIFTFNMRTEEETIEKHGKEVVKKKVTGGAYIESLKDYVRLGEGGDCDLCVLCIFTPLLIKEKIIKNIESIFSKVEQTRYAMLNVFNIVVNRSVETTNSMRMICSQFVDRMLKLANINIINKSSNLVSPNDFVQAQQHNPKIYALYNGKGSAYDERKIKRMINKIKKSSNPEDLCITLNGDSVVEGWEPTWESWFKTEYDPKHQTKQVIPLSTFKLVSMNQSFIDKYKNRDRMVKYAESTDLGYAWLDGDTLVGVVAVKPHADGRCNWIVTLGVTPSYQGHGLGEQMLKVAKTSLKGNALSVAYDNEVAIRMYKKQGFVISKKSQEMVDKGRRRVYFMFLPSVLQESVFGEILESLAVEESVLKSSLQSNHRKKGTKTLSSFQKVRLTQSLVDSFKQKNYKLMRYINDVDWLGTGYAWLDHGKLVGYVVVDKDQWITALEVTPDYQGYGLAKQMIVHAISMGGRKISVHDDNEVAITLYRSSGFIEVPSNSIGGDGEKDMIYMVHSTSTMDTLEESVIINKEDFLFGRNNTMLITGISGSGKSTLGEELAKEWNAELVSLDLFGILHPDYNMDNAVGHTTATYLRENQDVRNRLEDDIKRRNNGCPFGEPDWGSLSFKEEQKKFIDWLLTHCAIEKDTKFVIEGFQLLNPMLVPVERIKKFPMIILSCPIEECVLHVLQRRNNHQPIQMGMVSEQEQETLFARCEEQYRQMMELKKELDGVMETIVMEAGEDGDGLPSLGKDDNTEDYTTKAEQEIEKNDAESTENDPENTADGEDNEEGNDDLSELDDKTDDYTEYAEGDTSEEETGDTTATDDESDMDDTNVDTDETESQTTNNTIKNYQILRNFESLYRLASEISDTLEPMLMEKPIQNKVLVQVRENLSAIKKVIIDYITIHFNADDYPMNLYYYEVYFEALKKNIEILEKNQLFSKNSNDNRKQNRR